MKASIEQAEATITEQKSLIDVAQSNLNLAQLNLNRSQVVAPRDGTLSNFDLQVGNYVKTGDAVAALVDRKQLYVVGYFEETKLNHIHVGDKAVIQLMGDDQKIKGHVQGIASGIEDRERSTSSTLRPMSIRLLLGSVWHSVYRSKSYSMKRLTIHWHLWQDELRQSVLSSLNSKSKS